MANITITKLPSASNLSVGDEFPVMQGTVSTRKGTITQVTSLLTGETSFKTLNYETRAAVASISIPSTCTAIRTNGYALVGDGGEALYKRVAVQPSHDGKVQSADGAWWELVADCAVNVLAFGADRTGVLDATAHIAAARVFSSSIYVPTGIFLVDYVVLPQGTYLKTDGFGTIFKQKPQASEQAVIVVTGSDVVADDFSVIGNISTDTGEQNHAVAILGNITTGIISNVRLSNIYASNIRGDAFYISGTLNYAPRNVTVGAIYGDNTYRNVVSITSGDNIYIASIDGSAVGYLTFDAETNAAENPINNLHIGTIRGSHIGVIGTTATTYCDRVQIDCLDLNTSFTTGSTPAYSIALTEAIALRNTKEISIGLLRMENFNSTGIKVIYNAGELGCKNINIGYLSAKDCSLTEAVYNTYAQLNSDTILSIDSLSCTVQDNKSLALSGTVRISNGAVDLGASAMLAKSPNLLIVDGVTLTGSGMVTESAVGGVVRNSVISSGASRILSYCGAMTLDGVIAIATTPFVSSTTVVIQRSTINGVYYDMKSNSLSIGSVRITADSSVPSTGTWALGEQVLNSNPIVGQPKGWVCTVAGTPGTWVSMGNL
jgi:hypothetical protein